MKMNNEICSNRHRGSDTSIDALKSLPPELRTDISSRIYLFLKGTDGHTSKEITRLLQLNYTTVSARLSEMKRDGLIVQTNERREGAGVVVVTGGQLGLF